ncbi:MAG: isocitrate lyase/phosphoenolpyruvate mutase family protein [Pseudomonadota bacterium]
MTAAPETAATFQALHRGPNVLVLANAWDAGTAKVVEHAGAKAIATSSAAVAWSHGYADGHDLPIARLVATTEEIARVTRLPITVDAESGYADDPAESAINIAALARAGAVGVNLEDGREAPELHQRKIAAAREAAAREGVDLYINARVDVYLKQLVPVEQALEETIRRGRAAKAAGASGLFVPGLADRDAIRAIAAGVDLPLNLMLWPGLPSARELAQLGVRRLSAGGGLAHVAYGALRKAAEAFLAEGDSDALIAAGGEKLNYNAIFKG